MAINNEKQGVLKETVAMYMLMLPYAVFTTILGAILLNLLSEYSMPLTEGGFFNAVQNSGSFTGIILSGFIIDRYNKRAQIVAVFAMFAVSLFAIHLWSGFWPFVILLFFGGLVVKILDVLLNSGLADLHVENRGFYMNLLHACFGIGCFFGPILAGTVLGHTGRWSFAYLVLGLIALVILAFYIWCVRGKIRLEKKTIAEKAQAVGLRAIIDKRLGVLWLILFLYCGHQIGINNWLPTYMTETFGLDALAAGSGVSMFWLGLILGRVTCSFLTRIRPEHMLIRLGLLLGGVVLLAGVMAGNQFLLFAAVLLCGFLSGATIPMVLTIAYGWYPESRGMVSMFLYLGVSIGGVVFPWLMGVLEGVVGLDAAMAADAFMLLIPFVLMMFVPKQQGSA